MEIRRSCRRPLRIAGGALAVLAVGTLPAPLRAWRRRDGDAIDAGAAHRSVVPMMVCGAVLAAISVALSVLWWILAGRDASGDGVRPRGPYDY